MPISSKAYDGSPQVTETEVTYEDGARAASRRWKSISKIFGDNHK
jgi:hypothetical protein